MISTNIYKDDLELYLNEYIESRNIEDDKKIPAPMWAAAMMYIGDRTFKKDNSSIRPKNTVSYPYDLQAVSELVDRYIYMCFDHCQRVCLSHFSNLTGITLETINSWRTEKTRTKVYRDLDGNIIDSNRARSMDSDEYTVEASSLASDIYKKLLTASMTAAEDLLISKNGVNSIAYYNATKERFDRRMDKQEPAITMDADIIEKLGIAEELQQIGTHHNEIELLPELADDTEELPIV